MLTFCASLFGPATTAACKLSGSLQVNFWFGHFLSEYIYIHTYVCVCVRFPWLAFSPWLSSLSLSLSRENERLHCCIHHFCLHFLAPQHNLLFFGLLYQGAGFLT